ncbi:ATP-binding protein [Rhizobium sp. RU20A]|uniref:sensor histidine kinase n=1 Tax=Rhizobium sp. RU20A TaxID=1907412 RepID=UPI001FCE36CF|nr:ATP-binding protein [Rhizobium sp. RU20A]
MLAAGISSPFLRRSFLDEASSQAASTLSLAVAALNGHLRRYEALPALIADKDDIQDLLTRPDQKSFTANANHYLRAINTLVKSSDIYLLDDTGATIAASNFDQTASFVGENFSYRPYFHEAIAGREARFYALGTTSGKRGYYFSAPVRIFGTIRGVIVVKVDVDQIEASWPEAESRIIVTDPEGIIFMSGNRDWLYASLKPLTEERLARTRASRRYSDAVLRELPMTETRFRDHVLVTLSGKDGAAREYLALEEHVPDAGWTVHVLMDTTSVNSQTRTAMIVIVLSLLLAGFGLLVLIQRKVRRDEQLQMEIRAKAELERRVEERTSDLADVNQKLRETQADLIQAAKLAGLGQMSAALSHEFNQPLAAVRNYAESAALLMARGRTAEASDNVSRITKLVDRMASLGQHLRNFARKPNERLGAVPLANVLTDTLEIVAPRLNAAGARLEIDLGDPAPVVLAGPVRLQQVLVNIITNAADAVEGREVRVIELAARETGDSVIITLRDHGEGVPPAIAARIFDPFFTTKGVGKGLGLGLSISYNIVKDFGGELSVSNHEEGGAMFQITLAAAQQRMEAAQ